MAREWYVQTIAGYVAPTAGGMRTPPRRLSNDSFPRSWEAAKSHRRSRQRAPPQKPISSVLRVQPLFAAPPAPMRSPAGPRRGTGAGNKVRGGASERPKTPHRRQDGGSEHCREVRLRPFFVRVLRSRVFLGLTQSESDVLWMNPPNTQAAPQEIRPEGS